MIYVMVWALLRLGRHFAVVERAMLLIPGSWWQCAAHQQRGECGCVPMSSTEQETSRIIEMAWEDRTPFEAIEQQFGLNESQVILLMRSALKRSSFELWRARVSGRATKHLKLRNPEISRGYCPTQYKPR
jgi:uncharacterized protein (TIGR03643 family)